MNLGDFAGYPDALEKFWAFVRGDSDLSEFEGWLYSENAAEQALGPEGFLRVVETDFGDPQKVADLRYCLSRALPAPSVCQCHKYANEQLITMGATSLDAFEHVERGVLHMFWMHHFRCKVCLADWCLVEESRIYDVWMLFRGWTNRPMVETYRELLSLAIRMGASVTYVQPQISVEIPATIRDLAIECPGISVSEIGRLIPVPLKVIRDHAQLVTKEAGLSIDLEG